MQSATTFKEKGHYQIINIPEQCIVENIREYKFIYPC